MWQKAYWEKASEKVYRYGELYTLDYTRNILENTASVVGKWLMAFVDGPDPTIGSMLKPVPKEIILGQAEYVTALAMEHREPGDAEVRTCMNYVDCTFCAGTGELASPPNELQLRKESCIRQLLLLLPMRIIMPCGAAMLIQRRSDIPLDDTPCPCGNPNHWFVRWN